jgi:hypothetical protein
MNSDEFDNFQLRVAENRGVLERYEKMKDLNQKGATTERIKEVLTQYGPAEIKLKPELETGLYKD